MNLRKGNIEIRSVEDWFAHAPPRGRSLHWSDGRSAKELARARCSAASGPEVPPEIQSLFASKVELTGFIAEWGEPEARVRFDSVSGEPRNTDLVLVGASGARGVAVSVEAKADESFGPLVVEELSLAAQRVAQDEVRGKLNRNTCPRRLPSRLSAGR